MEYNLDEPDVRALTRDEWSNIRHVSAVDIWENEPLVNSLSVQPPNKVMQDHLFVIQWDNEQGRQGRDTSRWTLHELNRLLLHGQLYFKQCDAPWTRLYDAH